MEQEKGKKVIKEFEFSGKKYKLFEPNAKAIREARLHYSIKFTEGIKQGLFVKRALEKQLKASDKEFFEEHEKTRKDLIDKMVKTEEAIGATEDPVQLEVLAQMLAVYRENLLEEDQAINALFANTADQVADDERVNYLVFAMIRTEKGEPLAQSYEEFCDDADILLLDHCKYEFLCWQYQLDSDWASKLPETRAMDKVREIRLTKAKEEAKEEPKAKESEESAEQVGEPAEKVKSTRKKRQSKNSQ